LIYDGEEAGENETFSGGTIVAELNVLLFPYTLRFFKDGTEQRAYVRGLPADLLFAV
jgi:hypothetical protein